MLFRSKGGRCFSDEIATAFRDPALDEHDFELLDPERWEIAAVSLEAVPAGEPGMLTQRETEILQLVAVGYSSQAIADRLFISVPTVRKHRENLMRKLGLHNTASVTAYAIAHGLIPAG